MSNKGKHKCSCCGCLDDCSFVENDKKKKKYYCSSSCFRSAHMENSLLVGKDCASCGMSMQYACSPMYTIDPIDNKLLFFCRESCFAYHFGFLDEDSSDYKFIDERNRKFVKKESER